MAQRISDLSASPCGVVLILSDVAERIFDRRDLANGIVESGRYGAIRVLRLRQALERVVNVCGCSPAAVGAADAVAFGIIRGRFGCRIRIGRLGQAAHEVVLIACLPAQLIRRRVLFADRAVRDLSG